MPSPFVRRFKAKLDTFTDRLSFKELLRSAVEAPQQYDEYRIKVIYGHGGQGKTYLKRDYFVNSYLKQKSLTDRNLIFCDTIDFEHAPSTRAPENGLLCIAKALIEQGGLRLPAFTLAFLKLKQLNSLTSNLEEQYAYLYKITTHRINKGNLIDEVLQEIVDFAVGSGLSEMAGSIPLIGYFVKKMAGKGKNKVLEWFRESGAGEILEGLDDMDKFELLEKLPMFLGWDVYKALSTSAENGIPQMRIVIVIDGYETLWSDGKTKDTGRDLWVRKLAEYMTGVLIVIFGREALLWQEVERNQDFLNGIEQIPIDGFADEDANDYLLQVPIGNEAIRLAIIRNAKGSDPAGKCSPLYLQLEAKTYENIVNGGKVPAPDDFAQGNEKTEKEIFDRLMNHMDPVISGALGALSLANYINEDIILAMERVQAFPAASISMNALKEYSFMLEANGRLVVHGFVRAAAAEQYKKNHRQRFFWVQEALFKYFDSRLQFEAYTAITGELETAIEHAAFHKKQYDRAGFPAWILGKACMLYGNSLRGYDVLASELHDAVDVLEPADSFKFESYSEALNFDLSQLFYELADRYDTIVNRRSAKTHINYSIKALEYLYTPEKLHELKAKYESKLLSQQELHNIDRYRAALEKGAEIFVSLQRNIEAGELFLKLSNICNDFSLQYDRNEYMAYLLSIGRYSEAEAYFFNKYRQVSSSFDQLKETKNIDKQAYETAAYSVAEVAGDLGKVLRMQGRFQEAMKYNNIRLKLIEEQVGPNHLYTAYAKHGLATTYALEGKERDVAISLLEEVREVYEQTFTRKHFYYGLLLADFFQASSHIYTDATMEYFRDGMHVFSNQGVLNREGIACVLTAHEMAMKARGNSTIEDVEDAIKMMDNILVDLFHRRFEEMKNLFGVFHPFIHRGLRITTLILEKNGATARAEQVSKKVLEFERLMNLVLSIRADHDGRTELEEETKKQVYPLFSKIMSLPANPSLVTIEVTKLPFYKTFDLYRVSYEGLEVPVARFVLSDTNEAVLVDHTNGPIYAVGQRDFALQEMDAPAYAMFMGDTTVGRIGRFYLLRDGNDIPWQVDTTVSDQFKTSIAELIPSMKVVHEDEHVYHLDTAVLFKNSVFTSTHVINKHNGVINIQNERLLIFYETVQGEIGIFDEQFPPTQNYRTFSVIPASVDPQYEIVESNEIKDRFSHRIQQMLDIIEEDLIYLHPAVEKEGEELSQFARFQEFYQALRSRFVTDGRIDLRTFKNIVIYNYNANVMAYNNYLNMYEHSDQYAESLRNKMSVTDALLTEIDQYMAGQHPEQQETSQE